MPRLTATSAWAARVIARTVLRSWLLLVPAAGLAGCQPHYQNLLVDSEGNPIRLDAINSIVDDDNLDDAEKRQALQDIGISDETLIEVLIRG